MYETALLVAFVAALVAVFFGQQAIARPNKTEIVLTLLGINIIVRHIVLYIWLNLDSGSPQSSILRALDYVIGVPLMLMGLELFQTSAAARVRPGSRLIKPVTYLIPVIVLPMFTYLYYLIGVETARRLAVIVLLPALGSVLSYYLLLFRDNPYRIAKPEHERGMALILMGYLVLIFAAGIFAGVLRDTNLAITSELIAVLLIGTGGIVAGTVTFAGLYSQLNVGLIVVDKFGRIELTKLDRSIRMHGSNPLEARTATAVLPYIDTALDAVFRNGNEMVLPYVRIDPLNPGRVYQVNAIPHQLDGEGHAISALVVIGDVTDSMEEMETEQLSDLLKRIVNERDAAKFYLDLLSHDMGNLLQGIVFGLEIIEMERKEQMISQESIMSVMGQVDRSMNLLQEVKLIAQARETSPNIVPIDVREMIGKAIQNAEISVPEKSFLFSLTAPDNIPLILAEDMLADGITSVIKYCGKRQSKSHIQVDVSIEPPNARGEPLRILIADYGSGIADSIIPQAFDEQQRLHLVGEGVGLTLSKALITRYDGTIIVENRLADNPDSGIKFVIELPVVERD
ncbi:MAG: sensor histidine kinase [Candidatus Thorarchaeota archaeon]